MTLSAQAKYPSRRAYVLKMRGDARPDALAGRLENMVTGRQREFASARELLDAIAAELAACGESLPGR
jgi:3-hydroxyisobutyrate dehydrogenase-like beta-hydroxyacid dehydrogenase